MEVLETSDSNETNAVEQSFNENKSSKISIQQVGANNTCISENAITIHIQNYNTAQCLENHYLKNSKNINPDIIKSLIPIFENYRIERFEIKIKTNQGSVMLDVHPLDSIQSLKLKLQLIYGILFNKQIIVFDEKVLEDEDKLQDCKLTDGSVLNMVYTLQENGEVIVLKRVHGRVFCLGFDKNMTVKELKAKIEDTEGIPADRQQLFVDNTALSDEFKISDYNIHKSIVKIAVTVIENELNCVIVQTTDGRSLVFVIGMYETVKDLKYRIATKEGSVKHNLRKSMRIMIGKKELTDEVMLTQYCHIKPTVFIQLFRLKGGKTLGVPVSIRTAIGEIISFDPLSFEKTIADIKNMISRIKGFDWQRQRLFYMDKELENDKALEDYIMPQEKNPRVVFDLSVILMCPTNIINHQSQKELVLIK